MGGPVDCTQHIKKRKCSGKKTLCATRQKSTLIQGHTQDFILTEAKTFPPLPFIYIFLPILSSPPFLLPFPHPLPSSSLPFSYLPFYFSFPFLFFSPLYPFPSSPSLPGGPPLNPARGSGVHCKFPQWVWAEPSRQTVSGVFWAINSTSGDNLKFSVKHVANL